MTLRSNKEKRVTHNSFGSLASNRDEMKVLMGCRV